MTTAFVHTRESMLSSVYPSYRLVVHKWSQGSHTDAVVLCFHGYGAHGAYPTVRYPAELLASAGHVVYALDFPGHGESPGTRGLIRSPHDLTTDALALAQWATERHPGSPLVLFGTSMGGAVALNVSRACRIAHQMPSPVLTSMSADSADSSNTVAAGPAAGAVTETVKKSPTLDASAPLTTAQSNSAANDCLPPPSPSKQSSRPPPPPSSPKPVVSCVVVCAPMLGILNAPSPWKQGLLRGLGCLAPGAPLLGRADASSLDAQYRDVERRNECAGDELAYDGSMRLATAATCLDTALELRASLAEIEAPFLCLAAGDESIVDPTGAAALYAEASTPPELKKLVTYEHAKHGLFGEPPLERAAIEREVVDWVAKFVPLKDQVIKE